MAIFKCKICGGALDVQPHETVATCAYCGTQQTLPKLDDERRVNLYDRANHFRRNNDFDKAMGIYEQILNEDGTDAEAYWSLVLCRYGIEYVEDPATHKRLPTVNRAQFTSVFDDEDYKSALQYADGYQRTIYEEEATAINEIQKGILAISQKEEPFDVFICYKETDNNGRRTPDSVLANDLYHQLVQEGFKVFFSRITLEDKLGSAYEPYIFAALNSAKVMVALGTKPEYFNAVWVKNEWSRYLSLIKQGQAKVLIPAYKDMDPYDLPEEFSHLQAQDMGKLGFMQDLIRGIKKLTQADTPKTAVVRETVASSAANVAPLLKRAFMFLEDGDWNAADEYCEKVLDTDPENATAYLGKLLAEQRVKKQELLQEQATPFDESGNFQKAVRFADEELKATLIGYIEHINARNETARLEGIYANADTAMVAARDERGYIKAAQLFESIRDHRDAAARAQACREKAEAVRKDAILANGKAKMREETVRSCEEALYWFRSIAGWKDADEQAAACQKKIEELRAKAEKREKLIRTIAIIATPIVCVAMVFVILLDPLIIPTVKYNHAVGLMNDGDYNEAIAAFEELDGYKDSERKIGECNTAILDERYNRAIGLMNDGNIVEAYEALIAMDGYKDSADKANSIYDEYKVEKLKGAEVGDYVLFGAYEQDNVTGNGREEIEWLVLDVKDGKALVISKYALNCKPYNTSATGVTWETCTLRTWLNGDFFNTAFSAEEMARIPTVTVAADANPEYKTDPGNATQDKVFLLSIAEAEAYFVSDEVRRCEPTEYALANGAWRVDDIHCMWWLRSPGYQQTYAANCGGEVDGFGYCVFDDFCVVRPAMWIDLTV